jgi:hypothetical protein
MAARQGWAHCGHAKYWPLEEAKDKETLFWNPIPHLKNVCWFRPWAEFKNVKPGAYKLYMREAFDISPENLNNAAEVTIYIHKEKEKTKLVSFIWIKESNDYGKFKSKMSNNFYIDVDLTSEKEPAHITMEFIEKY